MRNSINNIKNKLQSFIETEKRNCGNELSGLYKWSHKTFKARVALRNWMNGQYTFWDYCDCCGKHSKFNILEYVNRLGTNECHVCH